MLSLSSDTSFSALKGYAQGRVFRAANSVKISDVGMKATGNYKVVKVEKCEFAKRIGQK
jgi:hypothetical protein